MMRIILIWVIILTFLAGCRQNRDIAELEHAITEILGSAEGDFALVFKNLEDTSQTVFVNEREMFHAASTMKTPVMIELFRQSREGKFSLDDSLTVKNEFRSIADSSRYRMDIDVDSEGALYEMIGRRRTINDLIRDMITMSSNLATNILIEHAGAANVTGTMRGYGADSILVLRGVEDLKAYEQGLSNRTTAYDESVIYEKLARGEAVGGEASKRMLEILQQQKFNEMIPARLPENVKVAHKTGWITGVNHDCGVVILPDGRQYVLVMLSKNAPDREEVLSAFAGVSRRIYEFMSGNY